MAVCLHAQFPSTSLQPTWPSLSWPPLPLNTPAPKQEEHQRAWTVKPGWQNRHDSDPPAAAAAAPPRLPLGRRAAAAPRRCPGLFHRSGGGRVGLHPPGRGAAGPKVNTSFCSSDNSLYYVTFRQAFNYCEFTILKKKSFKWFSCQI